MAYPFTRRSKLGRGRDAPGCFLPEPSPRWPSNQHYYRTWTVYRYGAKPKTLAKIFTGTRRENAIEGVIAGLERWRLTPFEREGDCRNEIRSVLCTQGHDWHAADAASADLVKEALRRMGAQRPSWEEGQWHYAIPREQCARCGGDIDAADQARGFRHCSPECARAHKVDLFGRLPADHPLRLAAYWQTYLAGAPALTCEHCGKGFKSKQWNSSTPRFCSKDCNSAAARTPPRPCAWCGTEFQPIKGRGRFCSRTCAGHLRVKEYRETLAPELTCPVCQTRFRAKSERSVYCSKACSRLQENARQRAAYDPAKAAAKFQRRLAKKKAAASGFICEAAE